MKNKQTKHLALALLAIPAWASAATITVPDKDPSVTNPNVKYQNKITMSGNDTASLAPNTSGAWSYDNDGPTGGYYQPGTILPKFGKPETEAPSFDSTQLVGLEFRNEDRGWTHTSRWYQIVLTEPTILSISITGNANALINPLDPASIVGTELIPGITLFSGLELDLVFLPRDENDPNSPHVFDNNKNPAWSDDLIFIASSAVASGPLSYDIALNAGSYSLNVGGNQAAGTVVPVTRGGFDLSLSTAVPEPTTGLLALLGLLGIVRRRR